MNKDFFENISIEKGNVKITSAQEIMEELNIIKTLILELNLENRIWTKV